MGGCLRTLLFLIVLSSFFLSYGSAEASPLEDLAERETVGSCYGYGDGLAGQLTASGEVFDPDAMTVAHRELPFGTLVEFRHADRTVLARVNDRGPFVGDREFDLSCGAMASLGLSPGVYGLSAQVF